MFASICSLLRRPSATKLAAPLVSSQTLRAFRSGVAGALATGATSTAQRHKGTYGAPLGSPGLLTTRKPRKQYNYLNTSRLIETPKKIPVHVQRVRDDKTLERRQHFKENLLRDVEQKIRFFPPLVKKRVFFPMSTINNRVLIFRGHRDLGTLLGTRLTCLVIEQLKKAENRSFLLEKMKELEVEPPTAAEWAKFTDPKTGDINIDVLYSPWIESLLCSFARMERKAHKQPQNLRSMAALRDYVVQNFANPSLVPSLESWSRAQGPVRETDFVGRPGSNVARQVQYKTNVQRMSQWGKQQAFDAVSALSLEEQLTLVKDVAQRRTQLLQELEERHLFATKFKHVLFSLDELKSIMGPCELFHNACARKFVMEHKGAYYPKHTRDTKAFTQLPKEERVRLCAFGYRFEAQPTTGQKLYVRCCVRDYGLPSSEASRRYGRLSDLQRAALCFPFYLPIAPTRATVASFKRFYRDMCARYGLANPNGPVLGNRLFEAAMRKRWNGLSMEERAQYEDSDRVADVFPLIKPATKESSTSSTEAMAEYFTEDHPRTSCSLDELLASTATKKEEAAEEEGEGKGCDEEPLVMSARGVSGSFAASPRGAAAVARATVRRVNGREAGSRAHHERLRVIVM
ncbi:hypothetical protein ABB37_01721 [Leptomonas pyrrhocoris]|uniref:Uncharacterized protein n=1 Tax=Leptomonas pyrrhocoris TaxID=157538 RepID=A0A0N0DZL1_LEPPY|nr:hypothetical protein ABB37_01721 [Leptomonas pyrrhocoris]KPA85412.1 hypothetical protein ABB37_01721 [Leptomonas pyrrhocoris]|eukprot:XP_015663851.1 hypothetical protein ABB37_01721 [Leptomonas pyrrhocoris]